MTELDLCVERFAVLNQEDMVHDRMEAFYAKCRELPIIYLEEALKRHKEESRNLENNLIPELMFQDGKRSVETMDGVTIKIKSEINASMKGADIELVYNWLNERGYGAIVKQRHYLADERDLEAVIDEGIPMLSEKEVNTNTLKKVLKEHYEKTDELPTDLLPVSIFNHATITFKKEETNE
jgi:hypothetical protein